MRNCKHCHKEYTKGSLKDQCTICYYRILKYGSLQPEKWDKKCEVCGIEFVSHRTRKYCDPCRKELKLRRSWTQYRKNKSRPIRKKNKHGMGSISKNGYQYVTRVGHPNAGICGRILKHRYVMSENIGRPLKKNENIHHINGIKSDNRIENLEIWHIGQPPGQRLEDKIKWAKDLLEEYGYKIS